VSRDVKMVGWVLAGSFQGFYYRRFNHCKIVA
jgi:hypothetical protein